MTAAANNTRRDAVDHGAYESAGSAHQRRPPRNRHHQLELTYQTDTLELT